MHYSHCSNAVYIFKAALCKSNIIKKIGEKTLKFLCKEHQFTAKISLWTLKYPLTISVIEYTSL